jgi:hypothetical protein
MAELAPVLKQRFFDANGSPLAGGKLYTYTANTSTPLATYTDSGALTPNANPVILDSDGYADVWISGGPYKFVLKDANDVTVLTEDNISTVPSAAAGSAAAAATSATSASNYALTAHRWATYTSGTVVDASTGVDSLEYSAKYWAQSVAANVAGSRASPQNITAAGGITSANYPEQIQFVQGNGGAITVTANPQVSAGTTVGQKLYIKGRSDTNTLTLANGNGLKLNGDWTGGDDDELVLWWDGTYWQERTRNR